MEPNMTLTGDEARSLMIALASSTAGLPSATVIGLWLRLSEISQVQPPTPQPEMKND